MSFVRSLARSHTTNQPISLALSLSLLLTTIDNISRDLKTDRSPLHIQSNTQVRAQKSLLRPCPFSNRNTHTRRLSNRSRGRMTSEHTHTRTKEYYTAEDDDGDDQVLLRTGKVVPPNNRYKKNERWRRITERVLDSFCFKILWGYMYVVVYGILTNYLQ